jgi:hypothetical protein
MDVYYPQIKSKVEAGWSQLEPHILTSWNYVETTLSKSEALKPIRESEAFKNIYKSTIEAYSSLLKQLRK